MKKRKLRIQGRMQIFRKNVPEGFKSCFDSAKRKSSKNAADPAKNYGFWKYMIFHYAKTLEINNFGPNVIYYVFVTPLKL